MKRLLMIIVLFQGAVLNSCTEKVDFFKKATLAIKERNFDKAIVFYNKYIEENPSDSEKYLLRCYANFAANNFDTIHSDLNNYYKLRGGKQTEEEFYSTIFVTLPLAKIGIISPINISAVNTDSEAYHLFCKGLSYWNSYVDLECDSAPVDLIDNAINLSDNPFNKLNMIMIKSDFVLMAGKKKMALDGYLEVLDIIDNNVGLRLNDGYNFLKIAHIEKLASLRCAKLMLSSEDKDQLKYLTRALSSDKFNTELLLSRATVLYKMKRYEDCLQDFEKYDSITNASRYHKDFMVTLTEVYTRVDKKQEALESALKVLHNDPTNRDVYIFMASIFKDLGEDAAASRCYQRSANNN